MISVAEQNRFFCLLERIESTDKKQWVWNQLEEYLVKTLEYYCQPKMRIFLSRAAMTKDNCKELITVNKQSTVNKVINRFIQGRKFTLKELACSKM